MVALEPSLASFVRLANSGGHQLLYHPASETDIQRDSDLARQQRTLARLRQYTRLEGCTACPWNSSDTSPNDACDNEILYALANDAAHALVTEDQRLHSRARAAGLSDRVYYIQSAEDWLSRLHAPAQIVLPNIQDVELHTFTSSLSDPFFDSLRAAYAPFNTWFRKKAQEGRRAWAYKTPPLNLLSAICIYAVQEDERINDQGEALLRRALKLCTFKVAEQVRGRKIGELFLRAAFRYATDQQCEHVFIHANPSHHSHLVSLLEDFGFHSRGTYGPDTVFVKHHPIDAPVVDMAPFEYLREFYPHFRADASIRKFIVPIRPQFHRILFPDHASNATPLPANHPQGHVGNAMKLAYLCHAPTNQVRAGDILLFYRTYDIRALTTLCVVERVAASTSATAIASMVSRRTVYSQDEIVEMSSRLTKVILFRLIHQFPDDSLSYDWLRTNRVVNGPIQSILQITNESFSRILR